MQADAFPERTEEVVRYLKQLGIPGVKLVKGPGYFCFEGPATDDWINHTVEVPFPSELTLDQWSQTFRAMNDNPNNRSTVRASCRFKDLDIPGICNSKFIRQLG